MITRESDGHSKQRSNCEPEEVAKVGGGTICDLLNTDAAKFRQKSGRVNDKSRLISLAAERHRRQERTVGFDKKPVERDNACGVSKVFGFLERHIAGERDQKAD